MKITFQGFRLYAGDGITLPEFGDVLVKNSSAVTEHNFNNHNRLFLFEDKSDPEFYTGLLITAKDQKTFPELRNNKGKLSIKVSELAEGSRLMDFNFFVLNKATFCGVYQHYHESLSTSQFGVFLRYFFWKAEKESRITAKTKELMQAEGLDATTAEAKARKSFKKLMTFHLFYKPDDFEKILKEMKEIKQFQFDISTKTAVQSVFSPDIQLKRRQESLAFANSTLVEKLSNAIGSFVKKEHIARGKVIAIDANDEVRPVYLTKNIDGFGEFDFDEVTSEIELDDLAKDFAASPVIKNLLAAARDNKVLFCTPDE